MKKLMVASLIAFTAVAANAGCWWSWWVGDDRANEKLEGCQLGIACECKEMTGAQVSLLWGRAKYIQGAQLAIGYNNIERLQNGPQIAFVNIAEASALQFGLLNFNKEGFLPFFPFFNMSTKMFGGGRK